jgi:hypothetical protein
MWIPSRPICPQQFLSRTASWPRFGQLATSCASGSTPSTEFHLPASFRPASLAAIALGLGLVACGGGGPTNGGPNIVPAEIGAVRVQALGSGDGNITLPFASASDQFTLVIESTAPNTAGNTIQVSGSAGTLLTEGRSLEGALASESTAAGETYIRRMERELLEGLPLGGAAPSRGLEPADEDEEVFFVVNKSTPISLTNPADFDVVDARRMYSGTHATIYLDKRAETSLTQAQIDAMGQRFDNQTYQTDVDAFGEPSDIDHNGHIIILLSPTVNALTTPDIAAQNARIIGFFFGIDLEINPTLNPFGNNREIFYGVVPNENMEFPGAKVTRAEAVELLGSVFAHEFEHMINFNQRVIVRRSFFLEEAWLDEGLAHMAEQINGFTTQNRLRSAFFLDSPSQVSLVGDGDGLDERGAAWLLVQYMVDRFGNQVLGKLVQTTLRGTTNVGNATGLPFATFFHEWSNMLVLDGSAIPNNDPIFELSSLDLRSEFEAAKAILGPERIPGTFLDRRSTPAGTGASFVLLQKGTSALYVDVTATSPGNAVVAIDGQAGAGLQVSIIRTR